MSDQCGWRDDRRLSRWHIVSYHPDVHISEVIHLSRLWSPTKFPHRFVCWRIVLIGCAMPPSESTNIAQQPPIDQSLLKNGITRKYCRSQKPALSTWVVGGGREWCSPSRNLVASVPGTTPIKLGNNAQRHTSAGGENQKEFNMGQSCIMHEVVHLVEVSMLQHC